MALDKNVSPDADTTLFFTRGSVGAVDGSIELPAGKIVEFLVGFANKVNIILNNIQSGIFGSYTHFVHLSSLLRWNFDFSPKYLAHKNAHK